MAFGIGDNLSVDVSANTATFTTGMSRAESATAELRRDLRRLGFVADDAEGELDSVGRSATTSAAQMGVLGGVTNSTNTSFMGLSATTISSLVPAMGTLLAAITPVVAALGGLVAIATSLAGAFSLVIGSGFLAYGKQLSEQAKERLKRINSEIKALKELKEERGELSDQQQNRLEGAKETLKQLTSLREGTNTLTEEQKKRLENLKDTRDELLKQAQTEGELADQQQKKLSKTTEEISQLTSLRSETARLTEEQRTRLEQAQQTIENLEEQQAQTGSLTQEEQKRLATLKESRRELKSQTSITGALAAEFASLKEELIPIIATFGEQFIPLIKDTLDALPTLVDDIINASEAAGGLAPAMRDIGNAIARFLPELAYLSTVIASEFAPVMADLAEDILPEIPGFIYDLVGAFRRVVPFFNDFGYFLGQFLPELMDFGMMALPIVANALGTVGGVLFDVIDFVNSLDVSMQGLLTKLTLIAPVVGAAIAILGGPLTATLAAVAGAAILLRDKFDISFSDVVTFVQNLWAKVQEIIPKIQTRLETFLEKVDVQSFANTIDNISDFISDLWDEVQTTLPLVKDAFNTFLDGVDLSDIVDNLGDLADTLSEELKTTMEDMKPVWQDFNDFLKDNKEEFKLIGEVVGDLVNGLLRAAITIVNVLAPVFRSVLIPTLRTFIDAADLVLTMIGDIVEATQELSKGNLEAAAQVGVETDAPTKFANLVTGQDMEQQEFQEQINQTIEVIVEGDEGVIKEVAAQTVNEEQRSTRRNQGRPANPN